LESVPFMDLDFERNISRTADPVLQQELERFQPDLIHVDEPDRLFLGMLKTPGVAYARRVNIPCVGFFHTNFIDYLDDYFSLPAIALNLLKWSSKQIISRVFNAYDLTVAASHQAQQRLMAIGIKTVMQDDLLGVDMDRFRAAQRHPNFFQDTYGIDGLQDKQILIFLGRLTPDKGWAFTISAFEHLADQIDLGQVALVIAGDGPLRNQINTRLGAIAPHLYLLGRIAPAAVPTLLVNGDIYITTSEKETKGLTVLEAFAAGCPVIAPRAGGVIDSITEGHNGLLYEPGNIDNFAQTLTRLLADSQLCQTLGRQAQADVLNHTWSEATKRLVMIWQDQIEQKCLD
jgi:glycosyltransferase involved in cell wall biosynthesis